MLTSMQSVRECMIASSLEAYPSPVLNCGHGLAEPNQDSDSPMMKQRAAN